MSKLPKNLLIKELTIRLKAMQSKMESVVISERVLKNQTVTELSVLKDIVYCLELIKDL